MNLKYIAKKAAVFSMVCMLSICSLTGCGGNTKIVFTTGLSGNQIFKIGPSVCTAPEAMVYLISFYNQYVDTYGLEMWDYDFGGVSLEAHVKNVVLSKLAQIKIMNLMAEERGISLSTDEETKVLEAAGSYYSMLAEKLKKQEKITEKVVEKVYREYALANKVYRTITESADMEISDDEARTVTVQVIYFKNWSMKDGEKVPFGENEAMNVLRTAKNVLSRIQGGEAFETLALNYSDDKQIDKSYARGSVDEYFEEILFSMDEGAVSGIIELADGYYIVKCISTMDYEATQENKLVLAEQRKKEAFSEAYQSIATNIHSQFRDRRWDKITLNEEIHESEANFFAIYDEYVK